MEASNKFKNAQIKEICKAQAVTGEYWLALSGRLDKRTMNRLGRIDETGKFKSIRKEKQKRDKSYATVIREYKSQKISHEEYVRKIVKLRRMHELPKTKAALLKQLEDSESETE